MDSGTLSKNVFLTQREKIVLEKMVIFRFLRYETEKLQCAVFYLRIQVFMILE